MANSIQINDFSLNVRTGRPLSFYGKLSQRTLPGIHLQFRVSAAEDIEAVENLLTLKVVQVSDPFAQQTYPASFVIHQWSTGNGYVGREYIGEVRALDKAPEYKTIAIDGNEFPVLVAHEEVIEIEQDQESIVRSLLLQLTSDQFATLQELRNSVTSQPLGMRRMGIDEQPRMVRFGGNMYWSKHTADGQTFYKQIVRLVEPADSPNGKGAVLALGLDQEILFGMVLALTARFQRLTDELVASNVLSSEQQADLLREDWKGLLDSQQNSRIMQEAWRVKDAEQVLKEEKPE
jgi:hypothetical protein